VGDEPLRPVHDIVAIPADRRRARPAGIAAGAFFSQAEAA
jgi:hypothetical protein